MSGSVFYQSIEYDVEAKRWMKVTKEVDAETGEVIAVTKEELPLEINTILSMLDKIAKKLAV